MDIQARIVLRMVSGVVLTVLCNNQPSACNTLVVIVPANRGIVIASDTRTTMGSSVCDGHTKLIVPKARKNTVVFYTGNGNQVSQPTRDVDVCKYLETTAPLLDINHFLVQQVNLYPDTILTKSELEQISARCVAYITRYAHGHRLSPSRDGSLFQAVVVNYDSEHEQVVVGEIKLVMDSPTQVRNQPPILSVYKQTDAADRIVLGETDYVARYVDIRTCDAQLKSKLTANVSLKYAASIAECIVQKTEEQAHIFSPPTGIGGPIDIFTITKCGVAKKRIKNNGLN
jgi:hypothetical protein